MSKNITSNVAIAALGTQFATQVIKSLINNNVLKLQNLKNPKLETIVVTGVVIAGGIWALSEMNKFKS